MNENHLFEAMGWTQTNEKELENIFSKEINDYLKSTVFIEKPDTGNTGKQDGGGSKRQSGSGSGDMIAKKEKVKKE